MMAIRKPPMMSRSLNMRKTQTTDWVSSTARNHGRLEMAYDEGGPICMGIAGIGINMATAYAAGARLGEVEFLVGAERPAQQAGPWA
mmetsp:Transcript_88030/g.249397  ORF Transcript_88030/g.249397 Transcript_88030/m.249397 type:complete len:87 (-) Transcript_88030:11-271(-)